MSRYSQERFRIGWYCRIVKEGSIQAGDDFVLIKRPNPNWTVARVQRYLYIKKDNDEVMQELADLDTLGNEMRNIFKNQLNKKFENQEQRLVGDSSVALNVWADYRLFKKANQTSSVISLEFVAVQLKDSAELVLPGTHVRLNLGG